MFTVSPFRSMMSLLTAVPGRLLHPYWIVHNRLCSECECFLGWSGEQRIIVSRSALMPLLVHSRVRNLYFYDGCANMGHRIGASSMARSSRWLVQLVRHRSRLNTVALQYPPQMLLHWQHTGHWSYGWHTEDEQYLGLGVFRLSCKYSLRYEVLCRSIQVLMARPGYRYVLLLALS